MKLQSIILFLALSLLFSCHNKYKGKSKAQWITNAFNSIKNGDYPRIKAVSWWNENWPNEDGSQTRLRIDSSPESLEAYRQSAKSDTFITTAFFDNEKLIPADKGIYHCAFPDFGGPEDIVTADRIDNFVELAQKDIVWAYFSNNWIDGIKFPSDAVSIIHSKGKVPFIRLMARTSFDEYKADSLYTMQSIIDGDFDEELIQWAKDAANTGFPLLAEFGTEVNGSWFPWNGLYCGGGTTDEYGDPTFPDGPERFRDAYRHIIDICRQNGATNITWFFHIDADSEPVEAWNDFENYYPGDDYIDWVGVSVYGPQQKGDDYHEFSEVLDQVYSRLANMTDKPMAILEFGVNEL